MRGSLSHWATRDTVALRVTTRAGRDAVSEEAGPDGPRLAIRTTAAPEGGKANAAIIKLVAKAIGVAPSALTLVKGAKGRDKVLALRR